MSQIAAVMWKESRELVGATGTRGRDGLVGLLFLGIFGVFSPWVHAESWVDMPIMLVAYGFLAGAAAAAPTIEAFAGERERHTLETLLATPLTDRSILLGKYFTAVIFGWGLVLVIVAVGLISVNVFHGRDEFIFYRPMFLVLTLLVPLLAAGLYAAVGIFISLRAPTVRQAGQTLGMSIVVLLIAPFIVMALLPEAWVGPFLDNVAALGTDRLILSLAALMLIFDGMLIMAALRRFRRGRLILD
jgi:ABC-2 type transport system permease protein